MGKLNNDENFRHINYYETDLRKTFARVRKQQAELKAKQDAEATANKQEASAKVRRIAK